MTNYNSAGGSDAQIAGSRANELGNEIFSQGKKYVCAYATGTHTAGMAFTLSVRTTANQSPCISALTDSNADHNLVCVPGTGLVSGDTDYVQVGGPVTITIATAATQTAGDGLLIYDGYVKDTGAAYTLADTEIGIVQTASETSTSVYAYLIGREALGTT